MNLPISLNPKTRDLVESFIKNPTNSLLLSGELGVGKFSVARLIATGMLQVDLNYIGPKLEVIDFSTITKGLDKIRDLNKDINFKTKDQIQKIFIFDNFDTISLEAYNGFLKTLEEPPTGIFFLLISSAKANLPTTIISRVKHISVIKPNKAEFIDLLVKKYPLMSLEVIEKTYLLHSGLPARIIKALDENDTEDNSIVDLAKTFLSSDGQNRLMIINDIYKDKPKTLLFLKMIQNMASVAISNNSKSSTWLKIYKSSRAASLYLEQNAQNRLVLINFVNDLI